MISFGGLGNGVDFGPIVDALVQAERFPIDRINERKLAAQAKKTDFGEVFVTALIIAIIGILFNIIPGLIGLVVLIVGAILIIWFIGQRHDIGFCLAIIVVIVAIVILIIVIILVGIILGLFGIVFVLLI